MMVENSVTSKLPNWQIVMPSRNNNFGIVGNDEFVFKILFIIIVGFIAQKNTFFTQLHTPSLLKIRYGVLCIFWRQ